MRTSGPGHPLRSLGLALWLAGCATASGPAYAGPQLERIRAENVVRCGAELRPGFAAGGEDGATGLAIDLCRSAAIAVLGPRGRIEFRILDGTAPFDAVRQGKLDLVFLSSGAIAEEKLAATILPGPPAFIDRWVLMVPDNSDIHRVEDLNGKTVCFMIATPAQRALETALDRSGTSVGRIGFEEDVEMQDAYNVGRCQAVVGEATAMAGMRQDGGVNRLRSRMIDPPLALDPIRAATSLEDAQWAATVAWLMHGLVSIGTRHSGWQGAVTPLDDTAARSLGLRDHWQDDITKALGTYPDMLRRHFGQGSGRDLDPGPNAPWPAGLMLPPLVE